MRFRQEFKKKKSRCTFKEKVSLKKISLQAIPVKKILSHPQVLKVNHAFCDTTMKHFIMSWKYKGVLASRAF